MKPTTRMGVPIPDYIDPSKFSYTYFQTTEISIIPPTDTRPKPK